MDRTFATEPRSAVQTSDALRQASAAPHHQRDFFIADILDASPKNDLASMEHPFFALAPGDRKIRRYEYNGQTIEVQPGAKGLATIHDKDIWIYCVSQLVEGINRGRNDPGPVVHFKAYSLLEATNRGVSGTSYRRLVEALDRLAGTRVVTDIPTAGQRTRENFGLIMKYKIVERSPEDTRQVAVAVTLPDWLYRSVQSMQVKTLSGDYFHIRKPLDRRVYELARKHCGNQPKWRVSIGVLYAKSGSMSTLRKFRMSVKALASAGSLPDYRLVLDDGGEMATFFNRGVKGAKAQIADILKAAKQKHGNPGGA